MTVAFTSFPGLPHSVAAARRFVTGAIRLHPWITAPPEMIDEMIGQAELITSELATNAIHHTRSGNPGESFTIHVRMGHEAVWTEVRTRAPRMGHSVPHVARTGDDLLTEHGRGLFLVDQLATTWGSLAPWQDGVYFILRWPTGRHGTEGE